MEEPKKESLIIYKGIPGRITQVGKKFDIELSNGEIKKVRDKDFITIHPGPVKSIKFPIMECDIKEIWTLLQGETFSLSELAEFLYGDSGVDATYNAYLKYEEGLYFLGDLKTLQCATEEFIQTELDKVKLKDLKDKQHEASISRLKKGSWNSDDEDALKEIEGVALEQRNSSKVLKELEIKDSSVDAHKFLIKIGYWETEKNPYPGRMAISLKSSIKRDDYSVSKNTLDLTHLKSYAIDDEGSTDPDDAISLESNNRVWVHITDVASIVLAGSNGDLDASSRGSNLYLPTETVHMLPKEVTDIQSLGQPDGNNTLSFLIEFDDDFNIIKREIHLARVIVTRLSYSEVELNRDDKVFSRLYTIADKLKQRRKESGAINISLPEVKIRVDESNHIDIKPINGIQSRNVVSEFMLIAGESAAIFCNENKIPIPYATQLPSDASGAPEDNLASMFVWRRKFKRGETKFSPQPHAGLGLEVYTRATSPLRRYSDSGC